MKFDHYEREETGYGVLLVDERSGLVIRAAHQHRQ